MDLVKAAFLPASLSVGIPLIDDQHADLFARLAALKEISLARNHVPDDELDSLLDFLAEHFATEEQMAREANLSFEAHIRTHNAVLRGIRRLAGLVHEGDADVYGLIKYIEYWFEKHILDEDKHLAFNLQQYAAFAGN